jgi:hypothetical protein
VVVEPYAEPEMEISRNEHRRRAIPEENHSGFSTLLLQWGQSIKEVLGIMLGSQRKVLYKHKVIRGSGPFYL